MYLLLQLLTTTFSILQRDCSHLLGTYIRCLAVPLTYVKDSQQNKMEIKVFCIILLSFKYSHGLSANEIAAFNNGVVVNTSINTTYYKITASGLPAHSTQKVNPNTPSHQNHEILIKKSPTFTRNTCLPLGKIGIAKNGVSLFNPLTDAGHDAVVGPNKEIFDTCNGHPTRTGEYHYHQLPICLYKGTVDEFIGVSLDGFPIYGPNVSDLGREIKQSDLDVCNGRTSTIKGVTEYRYYITREWPYIMGCFRGDVILDNESRGYNKSYVCSTTKPGCNCPIVRRPRRPRGSACSNLANQLLVTFLVALGGFISHYQD